LFKNCQFYANIEISAGLCNLRKLAGSAGQCTHKPVVVHIHPFWTLTVTYVLRQNCRVAGWWREILRKAKIEYYFELFIKKNKESRFVRVLYSMFLLLQNLYFLLFAFIIGTIKLQRDLFSYFVYLYIII
jgi:hypothetical protein